ncbi:transmembrane protein 26-like [Strongylocentrotus purpuratus]|uniref:Transmembrane protein 26 n=1 Tax=Strongylocentrotus purpuratus TaxID=7668 RepID=A0A7M7REK1_STRPU|nr:transmembrane protein 26-like [Strongylocentrotus purpuratus]|eukprot:XP_796133.2 PREDICTED: transmembrane protein 26-like [Strongylocentrotus purpuratus]
MALKCCEEHFSCSGTKLCLALVTRVMFIVHNLTSVARAVTVTDDRRLWFLALTIIGLLLETVFTIVKNKGEEWKWFCPSVLFFLAGSVPSIWILEFDLLNRRGVPAVSQDVQYTDDLVMARTWVLALEQLLLFVLIVGRWLLPKGEITRDQLSQLLLVYIATAADIIEFFDSFNSDESPYNRELITAVLTLWSWSLVQFTLVLTSTRGSPEYSLSVRPTQPRVLEETDVNKWHRLAKMRRVVMHTRIPWPWGRFGQVMPLPNPPGKNRVLPVRPEDEDKVYPYNRCACLESEIWAVMVALCLQDGPFLILRLILISHYKIFTHLSLFFTSKNALVLMLQLYRLIVVHQEKVAADNQRKLEHLKAQEEDERQSNVDLGETQMNDPYDIEQYRAAVQVLYRP